jgi:DNA-binding MarR family transcriptional regulator
MGMETLSDIDPLALKQLRDALMRAETLGLPAVICLITIALKEGISVSELADQTGAPQQSASRYVSQLMGRYQTEFSSTPFEPLVEQRISAADPRKRSLYLTQCGATLVRELIAARTSAGV